MRKGKMCAIQVYENDTIREHMYARHSRSELVEEKSLLNDKDMGI